MTEARRLIRFSTFEQRLAALPQLLEKGLISREEHDRQRSAILDKIGDAHYSV